MGCHQAKVQEQKQITESQIKIKIERLKQYAMLKKDQDIFKILEQEQQLKQLLKCNQRNKDQEYQLFSKLSSNIKYLDTINFIIAYCQALSDQTYKIVQSQGEINCLQDLIIYIESVIFASNKLDLMQTEDINQYFLFYFKLDVNNLQNVNPEIIKMYQSTLPTSYEINDYIKDFAHKYGISEIELNSVGHQFNVNSQQENNSNNIPLKKNTNQNLNMEIQTLSSNDINPGLINDENKNFKLTLPILIVNHNLEKTLNQKKRKIMTSNKLI